MEIQSVFKDDNISYIEDDVEKIRTKPGMYVPYRFSAGSMHLSRECIDNAIDESYNDESPSDTIEVMFDENTNTLDVSDNGRGIPFDMVELISTKIQSGSKFYRDNGDNSAGENGVGLTAVNALSHMLKYTIYRQVSSDEYQKGVFEFSEGKLVSKKISRPKQGVKHGTHVTFIPSEEVLGKCNIDPDALLDYLDKLSYILKSGLTLKATIFKVGVDNPITRKYKRKNGIVDYIDEMSHHPLIKPVFIKGDQKDENDDVRVKVAFTYDTNMGDEKIDSFVNRINTIDGGQHVNAARFAIAGVLTKLANDALSDVEKKKFEITSEDCRVGFCMVVVMSCRRPGFVGQQKEKCGNKELYKPVRAIVYREVLDYFKNNPKDLQKVVTFLKKIAKSRLEITKIRKSDVATFDTFTASTMDTFNDATKDSPENEIYINEGLSAKGSILKARDPRYQAVLAMRGVPANVISMNPAQVLKSAEFATLVRASGMGIGKDFDLSKSRYKRYIITTDADIDAINITSGVSCFFLFHWRPVVEAGMLYKALTPLYKIEDGHNKFKYLVSKVQLYEEKIKNYVKLVQIKAVDGHIMTKTEMTNFFNNNKDYLDLLKELYTYEYVNPDLIEFVLRYHDAEDFEMRLKEKFPEMKIAGDTNMMLSGSYHGVYQFLSVDERFFRKAEKLNQLINEVDKGEIYFDYKDKDSDTWHHWCSIGNILKNLSKYDPVIKARWKGLGSLSPDVFWDTVMNPLKRTMIRLTTTDIEEDLRKMRILHGNEPELRRMLLQNYKLDKDDIDT